MYKVVIVVKEQLETEARVPPEQVRQEVDMAFRRIRLELAYLRARILCQQALHVTRPDADVPPSDDASAHAG